MWHVPERGRRGQSKSTGNDGVIIAASVGLRGGPKPVSTQRRSAHGYGRSILRGWPATTVHKPLLYVRYALPTVWSMRSLLFFQNSDHACMWQGSIWSRTHQLFNFWILDTSTVPPIHILFVYCMYSIQKIVIYITFFFFNIIQVWALSLSLAHGVMGILVHCTDVKWPIKIQISLGFLASSCQVTDVSFLHFILSY